MSDVKVLIESIQKNCHDQLINSKLPNEYFYQSLTLAAIDAIYSANAKYPTVQSVIKRYCKKFNLEEFRPIKDSLPTIQTQEGVSSLIGRIEQIGVQSFASDVLENKTITSGRLKSEVLLDFLIQIRNLEIQKFQDAQWFLNSNDNKNKLVSSITGVHGVAGATSRYFLMLIGDDSMVKPDRMILKFIKNALGKSVEEQEAVSLIQNACKELKGKYQQLSPRLLDNIIWTWQRDQKEESYVHSPKLETKIKESTSNSECLTIPQKTQISMHARYNVGDLLTSSQIKNDVARDYGVNRGSVMPPDYCCNKWNKDPTSGIYHIFHYEFELKQYRLLPKLNITRPRRRGDCP